MSGQTELWIVVLGAIAATYVWRFSGVLLSRKIDTKSAVFQWFTCVSYAMLAGLIARMILFPVGPLTAVALWIRLICVAIGLLVFLFAGRNILLSVSVGLTLFIAMIAFNP